MTGTALREWIEAAGDELGLLGLWGGGEGEVGTSLRIVILPPGTVAVKATPSNTADFFLKDLDRQGSTLVVLSEGRHPPASWIESVENTSVFLSYSIHDAHLLKSRLQGLIGEVCLGYRQFHADLVEVEGLGVLILGASKSGKTRLALELAKQGRHWIADDAVVVTRDGPGRLVGRAHRAIRGLCHLRGIGIRSLVDMVGKDAVKEDTIVRIVVELDKKERDCGSRRILGYTLPCLRLDTRQGTERCARILQEVIYSWRRAGGWP